MSHYAGASIDCYLVNSSFHQIAADCPNVSGLAASLGMHRCLIELKLDADGLICFSFCFIGNNLTAENGGLGFELEVALIGEVEEFCGLVIVCLML